MRVFLDSSVLLAACASSRGASRELFRQARARRVTLVTSPWCLAEVARNLPALGRGAGAAWRRLQGGLRVAPTRIVVDRPLVFGAHKDRPVLVSALSAGCDCLLTLDRADFRNRLGPAFYGVAILTPGEWLARTA